MEIEAKHDVIPSLEEIDIEQGPKTVVKLARKIYNGREVIDVRKWHQARTSNKFYPQKFAGLCLDIYQWKRVSVALNQLLMNAPNEPLEVPK